MMWYESGAPVGPCNYTLTFNSLSPDHPLSGSCLLWFAWFPHYTHISINQDIKTNAICLHQCAVLCAIFSLVVLGIPAGKGKANTQVQTNKYVVC